MIPAPYVGPTVFGYETDLPLRRVAQISVHTSPLASLGGKDAGGMNVYIRELACNLARLGLPVDVFTRRTSPDQPEVTSPCDGVNVVAITAGPPAPVDKNDLFPLMPEFATQMALYSLREGVVTKLTGQAAEDLFPPIRDTYPGMPDRGLVAFSDCG